jgi:hypothetical protein
MSKKNDQSKTLILEQLAKTPIVEAACQKVGISRMTFYRWKAEDAAFAKAVDEAISGGRLLVNDVAESQLIGAVKERNLPAIMYWLKHHHPDYATTIQVKHEIRDEPLTPEQESLVREALRLASLTEETLIKDNENNHEQINDGRGESGGAVAAQAATNLPDELQKPNPAGTGGGNDQGPESPSGDR